MYYKIEYEALAQLEDFVAEQIHDDEIPQQRDNADSIKHCK